MRRTHIINVVSWYSIQLRHMPSCKKNHKLLDITIFIYSYIINASINISFQYWNSVLVNVLLALLWCLDVQCMIQDNSFKKSATGYFYVHPKKQTRDFMSQRDQRAMLSADRKFSHTSQKIANKKCTVLTKFSYWEKMQASSKFRFNYTRNRLHSLKN